jgi:ATP-binding cassette, subfamily B, multidrug efflux pump
MKLIFSYLKKYALYVVLIIALTYTQVQTELALPDHMSDIVTSGIQYSGITEEVPKILTEDDMNDILLFVSDDAKVLSHYELINKGDSALVDNQEIVFNTNAYYLLDDGSDIVDILQEPLVYTYMSKQVGLEVNSDNVESIKDKLNSQMQSVSDNYSSIVRIYIKDLYSSVGMNVETIQSNYILHAGLVMLGISAISVVVQLLSTYMATRIAAKIAAQMRLDVFEKIESFSSSEFSKFSTSSLITRTTNDITKIQQLIQMMLRMMLMSPMMGITAIFKVIKYPGVSWLLIVAIGLIVSMMIVLAIFAVPKFETIQKLADKINAVMREFLDGILVIRAFNTQTVEEEKFDAINGELSKVDRFVSKMMNITSPVMTFVMNGLTVGITWFSAKQIDIDAMTIGDMMAFSQYAMHVVISFMMVTVTFFMIPRSLVSVKRIKEVLDTKNTILDIDNPVEIPSVNSPLVFNNVYFKYPGAEENVLEDISFEALPGETVAIIGSTGSGKSTIVKLIPRLFDVSGGSITYGGIDIRNMKQSELRDKIGYATQKAVLFTGDIKSNIEFGRAVSEHELNNAIKISQSENIVSASKDGVNAPITQGGTNVSGGQKQRLSIARALAKDKNIYIFDDSFSALDYATDKKLRSELSELIKKSKATVIIVAQRISTIRNADKIIVLDEGKIVGLGKHEELLSNCETYKQIAYSQLSQEELA